MNRSRFEKVKQLQIDFLASAILESNRELQKPLIDVCIQICHTMGFNHSNDENIGTNLPPNGLAVIGNHIGFNKLTKITSELLENKLIGLGASGALRKIPPMPNNDPFIFLFAPIICALYNLFATAKMHLSIITMKYPNIYSNIVKRTGGMIVYSTGGSKYTNLLASALALSANCRNENKVPVFIIFPEGGTSGKRNNGSPYSLDVFKEGYSRLANKLEIPILPIIIYLNNDFNIETKALSFSNSSTKYDVNIDRERMQRILEKKHVS